MSQPDSNWPAWIGSIVALVGLIWTFFKWLLTSKFREVDARQQERHEQNLENFREVFTRLRKVEESQARTEGMLSGCYPRIDR
jgi:hypothetical protein